MLKLDTNVDFDTNKNTNLAKLLVRLEDPIQVQDSSAWTKDSLKILQLGKARLAQLDKPQNWNCRGLQFDAHWR